MPQITSSSPQTPTAPSPSSTLAPINRNSTSPLSRADPHFLLPIFFAAVLLNPLFSATTTFPLFHLAQKVASRSVAIITAWLWVALPAGIMMPFEWIWDTSLSVLLATTLLWMTLRISDSAKRSLWVIYALLWAIALLTNPSLGIALPFLLFWVALRARHVVQLSWRIPVRTLLLIVLCCLPWTIRNYTAFHRMIPVRSSLPFELWIGNNDIFDPHALNG